MRASRGNILVIRGGAIGDFILTLPAIAALRIQFPQARLEVLGYPHIVQLALAGGLVDRVQSIEARVLAGFFARGGELARELADYFSDFDVIVSYLYDPDEIFQANVGRCTKAQFIVGPHRPDETAGVHASKVYLKPLERLAIFEADTMPRLRINGGSSGREEPRSEKSEILPRGGTKSEISQSLLASAATSERKQLAVHPGSGSERKNWPEARWAELLQHLVRSTPFNLLIVGGEAEGDRLQQLAAALPPARLSLAQNLPLPELAALLSGCSAFIGHDSGIAHLAAAVGLPGLLLWGDSAEAIWRPPSQRIMVLRHPAGLASLSVAEVGRRLEQLWSDWAEELLLNAAAGQIIRLA